MPNFSPAVLSSLASFLAFCVTEYGSQSAALAAFDRAASDSARSGDVAGVVVASALGLAIEEGAEYPLAIARARMA